jgi:hypothetical protein
MKKFKMPRKMKKKLKKGNNSIQFVIKAYQIGAHIFNNDKK